MGTANKFMSQPCGIQNKSKLQFYETLFLKKITIVIFTALENVDPSSG